LVKGFKRGGLMSNTKYGNRFQCFKCGCKFYDLSRPKAICPKCGADQSDAPRHDHKQAQAASQKAPIIPEEELLEDIIPEAETGEEEELKLDEDIPLEIDEEETDIEG
jgi:hypothetical protein